MTNSEDLKNYIRTPKLALNPKYQSFFDEVYKLPSIEINAKIHKLTKGFNRLNQLIGMYNLYNAYVHYKSIPAFLPTMNEDELTLFKRRYDIVKFNDLKLITLHNNELIYESYELLKYPNIDIYKRQTFTDILEKFIQSEYEKAQPQQTEPNPGDVIEFKNTFDTVKESEVLKYFTKNLVEKGYLTKEKLNEYLKHAFELKTPPTQKFSFEKLPTQAKIRKVFYEYFKITAGKPSGQKKEYVKLLGEYFTGFNTEKLVTNFSK